MNPVAQESPRKNAVAISDVSAPKVQASPDQPAPAATGPEIVQGIPVKSPVDSVVSTKRQLSNNPISQISQAASGPAISDDKELDNILKDVNSSVKKAEDSIEERFAHLSGVRKKTAVKKAKMNEAHNGSPPIAVTVVALIAAAILITAAVTMYKGN